MAREINLNHLCKIEGHANLTLKIEHDKVERCELKAMEGARFFEALVVNKNLSDIQEIVSRICGICSSAHSVAAIQALEHALQMQPTPQQRSIRELLMLGERIRSHATHLYFLSLPDYLNASSALSLASKHKDKVNDALALITLGNRIVEAFGGREMHPFLKIKEEMPRTEFSGLLGQLRDAKPILARAIDLFANLPYPQLERTVDYLALKEKKEYTTISGRATSHTGNFSEEDYGKHLQENIREYATAKFVVKDGKPYMLGALARINLNHGQLGTEAKNALTKSLGTLKTSLPFSNPHHNLLCQAIELLEATNRSIEIIEHLPARQDLPQIRIREGKGVAAVEAPRGTLFHEYHIDKTGKITYCNIITPTAQNLNIIERDIAQVVDGLLQAGTSKEEIVRQVEKLIRAFDPCFSCSTHFLQVTWL